MIGLFTLQPLIAGVACSVEALSMKVFHLVHTAGPFILTRLSLHLHRLHQGRCPHRVRLRGPQLETIPIVMHGTSDLPTIGPRHTKQVPRA